MKRILGVTTAALMGASVLAAPAFAQADTNLPDYGAGETTTMPDIDAGTTAAIGGSVDGALAAIGNNATNAESIGAMTDISSVNVVRIGELEGDSTLVDQAVSQNADGIQELRAAVAANPDLSQELVARGVDSSAVVGAEVGAGGEVILYVM